MTENSQTKSFFKNGKPVNQASEADEVIIHTFDNKGKLVSEDRLFKSH